MLYPQNGDRVVAIDSVTSPPYVYRLATAKLTVQQKRSAFGRIAVELDCLFCAVSYCRMTNYELLR